MIASVDWTNVIVAGIVGTPAIIAAIFAGYVSRSVRTPSGEPLGKVVEKAHDLSAVNAAMLMTLNGTPTDPPAPLKEQKANGH